MVGRAGRPQFDTEGVAVIMTQKQVRAHGGAARPRCSGGQCTLPPPGALVPLQHAARYEQLAGGSEIVESTLKEMLPEVGGAEGCFLLMGASPKHRFHTTPRHRRST